MTLGGKKGAFREGFALRRKNDANAPQESTTTDNEGNDNTIIEPPRATTMSQKAPADVKPRRKIWNKPKIDRRKLPRHSNPARWKWAGIKQRNFSGARGITITGRISNTPRTFSNPNVSADLLLRWSEIDAGVLPQDEREHEMTDDEMQDKAADQLLPLEQDTFNKISNLEANTEKAVQKKHARAEVHEADMNKLTRPGSLRKSSALRRSAEHELQEAYSEIERKKENMNVFRATIRRDLQREQQVNEELNKEKIRELQARLDQEIEDWVNNIYIENGGEFELQSKTFR